MNKQPAPIKCPKCGSTKIIETMHEARVFDWYAWTGDRYELEGSDAEGGYCTISCYDCEHEYDKKTYELWIEQSRYFGDKQTW